MILVTFTRQQLPDGKPQLDYIQLESVDDIPAWLAGLGNRITFSLNKKKRTLTHEGWEKTGVLGANLIHVMDDTQKILVNVKKIVSNDGILFEDVRHCSGMIVDLMALKCVVAA